jgi:predicted O-linked N-acetylglucosamine transferase (SPINDLY family)
MNPGFALKIQSAMREAQTSYQKGQLNEAAALCQQVLKWEPAHLEAVNLAGIVAAQSGRPKVALEHFTNLVRLNPDSAMAHTNRGTALMTLGRLDPALAAFDKALKLDPRYAIALNNRGNALRQLKDPAAALACYDRALLIDAASPDLHHNRAQVLLDLRQQEAALRSLDRALELNPGFAAALYVRGNVLSSLGRYALAISDYDRAVRAAPKHAEAHNNRGNALLELGQTEAAIVSFKNAIIARADYAEAYLNRGNVHRQLHQYLEATACYDKAFALNPSLPFLRGARRNARMQLCDWAHFDADVEALTQGIERDEAIVSPFYLLALVDSPGLQRQAAGIWARTRCTVDSILGPIALHAPHERLRIGYFSADFRNHPVAALIAELIESHDRSRFEIFAFSFGPDTQDELRLRMQGAFDRFIDIRDSSDREIALLARSLQIDIAIDLGGYTQQARPKLFALRVAPVQVSYLGYLGTLGADFMDYLIADSTIIPAEHEQYYSERLLRLPSYQVSDRRRRIAAREFTRDELGLPATGFVYCCLNASYKITPAVFGGWMRILQRAPGSALMLLGGAPALIENLRNEACRCEVDADRLVFASRLPFEEYLARYRFMDLFLDTYPYNAGTTASDALWVGLPVLTRAGASFATRVAASLLTAIGIPELITSTRESYENRAVQLAQDPQQMAAIRERLAANRLTTRLFDTERCTASLEAGYLQIHERYRAGLAPDHITIASG